MNDAFAPKLRTLLLLTSLSSVACEGDVASPTHSGLPSRDEKLTVLPAVDPSQGFRVDEGEFTVQPGEDITYCVRIPIPEKYVGLDLGLIGWDWDLPTFTHHFFMAYSPNEFTGTGPTPCNGTDPITHNSGTGTGELSGLGEGKLIFGAGVGLGRYIGDERYGHVLARGGHLVTNHHVLNTSSAPVTMHGRFNLYVRDAKTIPHRVNELNCLSFDVALQPNSQRTVTTTCTAPFDLDVVLLSSHAHNHLIKFEERLFDGQKTLPDLLYSSDVWNEPRLDWTEPPVHLKRGQGLTFSCYYENPESTPVTFGTNVQNEMCATMNGYSLPDGQEFAETPPLGAMITSNGGDGVPPTCGTIDLATNQYKVAENCDVQDTTQSPIPFF